MAQQITQTDAELLRLISDGDEEAFTMLYRRRQAGVYRFALHMSGSEAVAEDVVQEVFMVLMRDFNRYDPARGSLAAYLYGVARNLVLRLMQKDRALVSLPEEYEEDESWATLSASPASKADPLGDLTRLETVERVRQAVLALPQHYREAVVLCELHELSYAEAAQALGCAVGTVRSRLHRGRAMLIERLRKTDDAQAHDAPTLNTARCFA